MAKPDPRNLIHLAAAGFGSGLAPRAPGTFGSLAALLPWWALQCLTPLHYGLAIAVGLIAGIFLCGKTALDLRIRDHGAIVWDEFVGMWITLAPLVAMEVEEPRRWLAVPAGFALFRLFDIWKPWPISWCDRNLHGGVGIMLDDALAGVVAGLALWAGLLLT